MLQLLQDTYTVALFEDGTSAEDIKAKLDATGKYDYFTLKNIKTMLEGKAVIPDYTEESAMIVKVPVL